MISIVQNFICTDENRLNILLNNLPDLGKVFSKYKFYTNFNDTVNLDVIRNSYNKNIPNLEFYNNLEKDWALITLAMVEQVTTPYLLYLCEDQVVHATQDDIDNLLNEINSLNIDFVNLTKIGKYSKKDIPGYTEAKYGYTYLGKDSPTGRLSSDCIVRTAFWKERLIEFINNKHKCPHTIPYPYDNLPNYFEGYYDHSIGIRKFKDLKCYIPKQHIFIEYNDVLQKHTYAGR